MARYILLRSWRWIPSMLLVALIVWAMAFYGAGDPIRMMCQGEQAACTEEQIEAMRKAAGLDRPFYVLFGEYVWNVMRGDLGKSILTNRAVIDLVRRPALVSLKLGIIATIMMGLIGIPLGAVAALNHNRWLDRAIVVTALMLQAVPIYVIAPFLLIFLALGLGVKGVYGWDAAFLSTKAILPILVLTLTGLTGVLRLTRVLVLDVLSEDYIRTARAKGIPERVVLLRHILRPVLVPVITSLGQIMIGIVNGAIIVEQVFGVPGLGKKTIDFTTGMYGVDYPVLVTITLIGALLVMVSNLLVDVTYPVLDPRARGAMVGEEE